MTSSNWRDMFEQGRNGNGRGVERNMGGVVHLCNRVAINRLTRPHRTAMNPTMRVRPRLI